MKPVKKYFHFRAFILMAVYLFIVITHLFFSPQFQADAATGHKQTVKRNAELIYNLIKTDRGLFDESKKSELSATKHLISFTSLSIHRNPLLSAETYNYYNCSFKPNHHFSYLSNRVLRI